MVTEITKAFELVKIDEEKKSLEKNSKKDIDKVCPGGYLPWRNVCLPISIGF